MKKVLLVTWGTIHVGGVQMLLLDLLCHMDRSEFQIDLYTFGGIDAPNIYQRLAKLGVNVILGGHDSYDRKSIIQDLRALMKKEHYDIVHCNTGGLELTAITMGTAWLFRIPVRIAHSHNSKSNSFPYSKRERFYQWINRTLSTTRFACSDLAAEHLFGKRGTKRCTLIKNGIEPGKFRFDLNCRETVRHEMGLENALVIGHVGRFEKQKNHEFLLDVFGEVKRRRDNAILLLIGEGSLLEAMKEKTECLGLSDSVRFLGATNRVSDYLQAMDLFFFPSAYEGLGIVAVEAQASDLPTVCSDAVPYEAGVTSRFLRFPLSSKAGEWSEKILEIADTAGERMDRSLEIREAGYDISDSAGRLYRVYFGLTE